MRKKYIQEHGEYDTPAVINVPVPVDIIIVQLLLVIEDINNVDPITSVHSKIGDPDEDCICYE